MQKEQSSERKIFPYRTSEKVVEQLNKLKKAGKYSSLQATLDDLILNFGEQLSRLKSRNHELEKENIQLLRLLAKKIIAQ